jgi:hypothetical protein
MNEREVIEWAPFRARPGVTDEQLLEASRALQEGFLAKQRGFVRRDLLRGKDGAWVDVVYWADHAAVDAAMKAVSESPVCHTYFGLMAGADHAAPGEGVLLFERAASYGATRT